MNQVKIIQQFLFILICHGACFSYIIKNLKSAMVFMKQLNNEMISRKVRPTGQILPCWQTCTEALNSTICHTGHPHSWNSHACISLPQPQWTGRWIDRPPAPLVYCSVDNRLQCEKSSVKARPMRCQNFGPQPGIGTCFSLVSLNSLTFLYNTEISKNMAR